MNSSFIQHNSLLISSAHESYSYTQSYFVTMFVFVVAIVFTYRIAGNIGGGLNLADWRFSGNPAAKICFSLLHNVD